MRAVPNAKRGISAQDHVRYFVHEYLIDMNARRAARATGICTPYTANRFVEQPHVQQVIQEELQRRWVAEELSPDAVLAELAAIAFVDIRQLMRWDDHGMHLTPSELVPRHVAAAVQSVRVTTRKLYSKDGDEIGTESKVDIRLHSKLKALELLGQYYALFKHDAQFLDAFVEVVLRYVDTEEGKTAIVAFLQEHAGKPAPPTLPAAYTPISADAESDGAGLDASGGDDA